MFDLIIRNGTIVDGTGRPRFQADVGVKNGRIAAIGKIEETGIEEFDATGRLVTPGFVDVHTHYDGHVTWTDRLYPSSSHGVTTVLMGNCGVGFAPCKPKDRERLLLLMEGVEDIPEVVMTAGLPWDWESFPEYLDRLDERAYDMDVATQVPHAPLRVFVMGERAAAREPATAEDIVQMRELAREAIEAGALGFTTSRTLNHRATDGSITPTYGSASDELAGIALGLKQAGKGVLQLISDWGDVDEESDILRRMMTESGRPLATTLLQSSAAPDRWRKVLGFIEKASAEGFQIKGQVAGRPVGAMMGLGLAYNPFIYAAGYRELLHLSPAERAAAMRDPARRERILAEQQDILTSETERGTLPIRYLNLFHSMYDFDETGYEPLAEQSIAAMAAVAGVESSTLAYDFLARGDGDSVLYMPSTNFAGNSVSAAYEMMMHKDTVLGLGDGGAHCSVICDASLTTWMLERWAEPNGGPLPIEQVIKALTSETAESVGLYDRGVIAPGYRADFNIIDVEHAKVGRPEMMNDLPTGATRLHQSATGYDATIVAGQITYRKGVPTGALPGRLVRGGQPAPQ